MSGKEARKGLNRMTEEWQYRIWLACDRKMSTITIGGGDSKEVVIDSEFVRQHPVGGHAELYTRIGLTATSLTLSNVQEKDAVWILSAFKSTRNLTMNSLVIIGKESRLLPLNLESLQLVDCKISHEILRPWFVGYVGFTLKRLYVENSVFGFSTDDSVRISISIDEKLSSKVGWPLTQLDDLTIIHDKVNLEIKDVDKVKCLKIVARECKLHVNKSTLPGKVSLDCREEDMKDVLRLQSGGSLSLSRCSDEIINMIFKHTGLEHLQIRCNPEQGERLENLRTKQGFKTLDLDCEMKPDQTAIQLLCLNDDCLYLILTHLSLEELLIVGEVHPKLHYVCNKRINGMTEIHISRDFWKQHPFDVHQDLYLRRNATTLSLDNIEEGDALFLIQWFNDISALKLEEVYIHTPRRLESYPRLKKLTWVCCSIPRELVIQLFEELEFLERRGETDMDSTVYELKRLRHFRVEGDPLSVDSAEFLIQNKDTLERLDIRHLVEYIESKQSYEEDEPFEYSSDLWEAFQHLTKLKVLNLDEFSTYLLSKKKKVGIPSLEEFSLYSAAIEYAKPFLRIPGANLKKLRLRVEPWGYGEEAHVQNNVKKFKNLEELHLTGMHYKFSDLVASKELKVFSGIDERTDAGPICDCEDDMLEFIKKLPKLVRLTTHMIYFTFEFEMKLRQFLKAKNNRVLFLNNKKL